MGRKLPALLAAVTAVAATAPAAADTGHRGDFDFRFTTTAPASATGLWLRLHYRDEHDPNAKPQPLRKLIIAMPAGTRFDGSVLPACHASDDDLKSRGDAACPASSRVGTGSLSVMTGFPAPADVVQTTTTLYNGGDQIIEVADQPDTPVPLGSDRLHFDGSRLVADPPAIPGGPPDGQSSVRDVVFDVARHSVFVTTPPSCSGSWSALATFGFADGVFDSAGSTVACAATQPASGQGPGRAPGLSIRVRPVRVAARRAARVVVTVSSPAAACRRGAIVRVGRRRYRSSARGRVVARLRTTHAARHVVRAYKPGCGSAATALRAVA